MSWFELELCKTSGILHKIVLKETALWHQCQLEKMITHWSWGFAFSHIQLCPLQKSCKLIDLELQPGHQNCGPWSFCISPTHWNISLPRLINETKFTKDQNVMQIQKQFVEWAYLSWNTISLRTTLVPTKQANLWCRISRGTRALALWKAILVPPASMSSTSGLKPEPVTQTFKISSFFLVMWLAKLCRYSTLYVKRQYSAKDPVKNR